MSELNSDIKDLNLLLLYLSGWEEESKKEPGKKVFKAWKGYLFDVLNELNNDGMIRQYMNRKSIFITDEGIKRAKEVKEKFL